MSYNRLYLIDAYNLLFRCAREKGKLEEHRRKLVSKINTIASCLHLHVTLVFDGKDEHLSSALLAHFDTIAIVYTPSHQTADDYILQEVKDSSNPSSLIVVSNDTELTRKCALHKAKTMTLENFFSCLQKRKMKKGSTPAFLFQDSSKEIARLLAIFEKKLQDNDS